MTARAHVAVTISVGFALIGAVLLGVLLQSPNTVIASNHLTVRGEVGPFEPHTKVCQANEPLPASTAAIRVSIIAYLGPAVSVTVSQRGQIVSRGHRGTGWIGGSLTLPLEHPIAALTDAEICVTRSPGPLAAGLLANISPPVRAATSNGTPLRGRMRIEYLAPGHRSWLSQAKFVARRLGLGHSPSGTWIVLPLLAVMAIAVALGTWLLIREQPNE
jgi:hypothetical protein